MQATSVIAFSLGVVAYSVASTLFFVALLRQASSRSGRYGALFLGAASVFHAAHIVITAFLTRTCPVESMHFTLSASALVMAIGFLGVRRRFRLDALGALVGPIALAFLITAQFLAVPADEPAVPRFWLALHVTANLLGVGLFLLAGAASAFYLILERRLKLKRGLAGHGRLPALDSLDFVTMRLLVLGYPLLTFGVVTGGMFFQSLSGHDSVSVLRAALGYASWLLLGIVLLSRALLGHRGHKSAQGTLAGVACVVLLLFVYLLSPKDERLKENQEVVGHALADGERS